MKFATTAVALAGLVASANAHATFQKFWTSGSASSTTCVRQPTNNSPLTTTGSNIACNNGGDSPAASVCVVGAGTQVAFEMQQQPNTSNCNNEAIGGNHDGPTIIYMKKVSDSKTASGSGGGWFKVAQTGLVSASGSNYVWGTDTMNSNCGKVSFTIPVCLAAGHYLVRAEVIALHVAGSSGGAQHYASCAQIQVTGGGSSSGSPTVSFPGAYSNNDPGILFNMYGSYTSYQVPGPAVFSCGGQPGTTGNPATVTPTQPTTTPGTPTTSATGPAQTAWGQCGGTGWTGPTSCVSGYKCQVNNAYYSQCVPA